MKKILVTGCNGQLGRAIRKEYAGSDVEFVNTDVTEGEGVKALDITDVVLNICRREEYLIWQKKALFFQLRKKKNFLSR